jgi:hypothetical protein
MPYKDELRKREASRRHYLKNREAILARTKRRRESISETVNKLKEENPCVDCGVKYPYYVMQYDHISTDKLAGVSYLIRYGRPQEVLDEIEKCELVCANCHAIRTWSRHKK